MFQTLDDWTKPKADEIAAFTQLQALNQGNTTLSEFILEVQRLAELCNLTCNGDKEKLIRNCIVAGVTSTKGIPTMHIQMIILNPVRVYRNFPNGRCNT